MKHNTKRFAAAALTAVLAVGMMTGCGNSGGKGEVTQNGNETLFTYDGEDVSLKKAWNLMRTENVNTLPIVLEGNELEGFKIAEGNLSFKGVCGECQKKENQGKRP